MEKEHGFTECSEWAEYFQKYRDRILDIEKMSAFTTSRHMSGQAWLAMYKERSLRLREMYLNNEKYLERHVYWFIKNPEHWEEDVASSLLNYLFRHCQHIEDIEASEKTAESLYEYYKKAGNEIAMMKCVLIFVMNIVMLDFPHNKGKILEMTEWAIDVYERNYENLNAVERSMGLSFYDIESNACLEYVNYQPLVSAETMIAHFQRRMERIERFMQEEDLTLKVNQIVPYLKVCWQSSFISMLIKIVGKAFTLEQLAVFESVCDQMKEEAGEVGGVSRHVKIDLIKLVLQAKRGEISNDEVMEGLVKLQNKLPKPSVDYNDELMDAYQMLSCAIRMIAGNDKKYQREVHSILQILLSAYMRQPSDNYMKHIMDNAIFLYMFPLLNVLPYEEIIRITLFLTVFRQPQTAAHTIMVSKLATATVNAMIEKKPELFMSMRCFSSINMVQINKKGIVDYVGEAALLHDVGKILCTNVISMQYRRLIDLEYEAIKLHPVSSGEILKQIPVIANYSDIAMGHHRSYDGKFGYPANFDNFNSSQKLFIDLITVCDTLDAATDNLGRNYAKTKQFSEVLGELEAHKGTWYSTEIVDLIQNDKALQAELQRILNQREESYIQVFELIDKELQEYLSQE